MDSGMNLNLSASVEFVALFPVAMLNGEWIVGRRTKKQVNRRCSPRHGLESLGRLRRRAVVLKDRTVK